MEQLLQSTILYAIPLLIVALAGVFSERSGIINLALEGEMIFGAFIGAIFARLTLEAEWFNRDTLQLLFICSMVVAAIAGAAFSLLLSWSAIKLKADQTIGGTALNMLAPAIVCSFGLLFFNSERIDMRNSEFVGYVIKTEGLSGIAAVFFDKFYISTFIVIILYILLSIWLYKSKTGVHLRACGEHPQAADSVGINVHKMRYLGTTISGALAGLGGYVYIATCCNGSAEASIAGMGFLALAIMIFGNWNPILIAFGAFIFGFLNTLGVLSSQIEFFAQFNLPLYFYRLIPYVMVLIILIIGRNKSGCPKAEGIPYDKGMR